MVLSLSDYKFKVLFFKYLIKNIMDSNRTFFIDELLTIMIIKNADDDSNTCCARQANYSDVVVKIFTAL